MAVIHDGAGALTSDNPAAPLLGPPREKTSAGMTGKGGGALIPDDVNVGERMFQGEGECLKRQEERWRLPWFGGAGLSSLSF